MENSILRTLKNFSLMERQIPICRIEAGSSDPAFFMPKTGKSLNPLQMDRET